MQIIEQSISITIRIGPFLDEDDGKTAETALSIVQADIRLSKNGGDFAQSNDVGGATHDEFGWYYLTLDATDTGALGRLIVAIHDSGNALPVWREFMVMPENVWDSLIGGTDYLQADAVQVEGVDATDQINAECDTAIVDAALATATNLQTVDDNVDAVLADTETDGVVLADGAVTAAKIATDAIGSDEVAASGANKIADHVIRRSFQNACDSSDGDAKTGRSLLGAIAKLVNKIAVGGGNLTMYEDDDSTTLFTQAVTTNPSADPIVALDTT